MYVCGGGGGRGGVGVFILSCTTKYYTFKPPLILLIHINSHFYERSVFLRIYNLVISLRL